jgi:transglutaminase superfamily protein
MIRALGLLVAAAAAISAWEQFLGSSVRWAAVVAVAAALVLCWERARRPLATMIVFGWPVLALLAAGESPGVLWPSRWNEFAVALSEGANRLVLLDPGSAEGDPWPSVVWLVLVGALWLAAAASMVSLPASLPVSIATLALVTLPWVVAAVVRQTDQVAWQGAALVLAGLLWLAPGRSRAARPLLAVGLLAALVAVAVGQSAGPREQWFAVDEMVGREPQFRTLDTTQTYGPLEGRRTGATMLEITSPVPGLWRMQTLDRFGWRGWEIGGSVLEDDELPEPLARPVDIEVQVRGLRNDLVVAPGQILDVRAEGRRATPAWGGGYRVTPRPRSGDTYKVRANVVTADAATLRAAPGPSNPELYKYTRIQGRWGVGGLMGQLGRYGSMPDSTDISQPFRHYSRYSEVAYLSQQLSAGAANQYEVVERVERYLTETGGFRYDTDVERTSRIPLQDFLLNTKTGYCQHFAGAAALLLRLAGVPTRVVAGFATGRQQGGGFVVRDTDAHAWIEVYFEGVGWVPFNPTPGAAEAEIDPSLDPLAAATAAGGDGGSSVPSAVALSLALGTGLVFVLRLGRRRRRTERSAQALLEAIARGAGAVVTPATTLSDLGTRLAAVGPRLAGLAAELERDRYGPAPPAPGRNRRRSAILRALLADAGPRRAGALLVRTAVRRR